jgi:nitronate monooxygenase
MRTRICDFLGIEIPIFFAPMGPNLSGVELTAAVSQAGGLGILQSQLSPPNLLREEIQNIRMLTNKPFGVNFILYFPSEHGVQLCLEERVPLLSFFWGDPAPYIERSHQAGTKVMCRVGSVESARKCSDAGVDIIIAQGVEAGGHIEGEVTTMALVPLMVDAVSPRFVLAAGGIADGRGVAAALALGADGVVMGTRFLASEEANAHPLYKQKLLNAAEKDTVRTTLFGVEWPNAPHRTLRTPFVNHWLSKEAEEPMGPDDVLIGQTTVAGQTFPLKRFAGFPPLLRCYG